MRWAKRRPVRSCAAAAKRESTTAQNNSEPFCPAQSAEKMYADGRLRDVYAQTYSMLKSWVISPFQSEIAATRRQPEITYTERTMVELSSGRPRQRPEKERTMHQRPMRKAA